MWERVRERERERERTEQRVSWSNFNGCLFFNGFIQMGLEDFDLIIRSHIASSSSFYSFLIRTYERRRDIILLLPCTSLSLSLSPFSPLSSYIHRHSVSLLSGQWMIKSSVTSYRFGAEERERGGRVVHKRVFFYRFRCAGVDISYISESSISYMKRVIMIHWCLYIYKYISK